MHTVVKHRLESEVRNHPNETLHLLVACTQH